MKPSSFSYSRPLTVEDAVAGLASEHETKIIAGGQSLVPMLNLRMVSADALIDVTGIPALRQVVDEENTVRLGACITHDEIASGAVPDPSKGLMPYVGARIAYQAVRNRGTLGGSLALADPAADWVTTMATLRAVIECRGQSGLRRIPAHEFVVGPYTTALDPGELLTAISIPKAATDMAWGVYKLCRKTGEFAHAMAMVARLPGASSAFLGATNGAPIPLSRVASILDRVRDWDDALERRIAEAFDSDLGSVAHVLDEVRVRQARTCLVRAVKMSFGLNTPQPELA